MMRDKSAVRFERNANGAALTGERGENRLADPPHGVEMNFTPWSDRTSGSGEQPDVSLADEIDEGHAAVLVLFGNGDHEAQVALNELLQCVCIARANAAGNLDLFVPLEQRISADLIEVLIENVPLGLAWRDSSDGRLATTLYFSALKHSGTSACRSKASSQDDRRWNRAKRAERDILDQVLYEVSTYPLLKGNEEIEVARRIRAAMQTHCRSSFSATCAS